MTGSSLIDLSETEAVLLQSAARAALPIAGFEPELAEDLAELARHQMTRLSTGAIVGALRVLDRAIEFGTIGVLHGGTEGPELLGRLELEVAVIATGKYLAAFRELAKPSPAPDVPLSAIETGVLRFVGTRPAGVSRGQVVLALSLSPRTASRTLARLARIGQLRKSGKGRSTRYHQPEGAPQ